MNTLSIILIVILSKIVWVSYGCYHAKKRAKYLGLAHNSWRDYYFGRASYNEIRAQYGWSLGFSPFILIYRLIIYGLKGIFVIEN